LCRKIENWNFTIFGDEKKSNFWPLKKYFFFFFREKKGTILRILPQCVILEILRDCRLKNCCKDIKKKIIFPPDLKMSNFRCDKKYEKMPESFTSTLIFIHTCLRNLLIETEKKIPIVHKKYYYYTILTVFFARIHYYSNIKYKNFAPLLKKISLLIFFLFFYPFLSHFKIFPPLKKCM